MPLSCSSAFQGTALRARYEALMAMRSGQNTGFIELLFKPLKHRIDLLAREKWDHDRRVANSLRSTECQMMLLKKKTGNAGGDVPRHAQRGQRDGRRHDR